MIISNTADKKDKPSTLSIVSPKMAGVLLNKQPE